MEGHTDSSASGPHKGLRLLALEVRPHCFGFVVFEGPLKLLDWGKRRFAGAPAIRRQLVASKIEALLKAYSPMSLVMRTREVSSRRTTESVRLAIETIRAQGNILSVKLHSLDASVVRTHFARLGCTTKHEIASWIAREFEELSWKLQPSRKPWHSERSSMPVFDAAASGIVYFSQFERPA